MTAPRRLSQEAREALGWADDECPAGGPHTWGVLEQAGTGRTGFGCEECMAPMPPDPD